MNTRFDLDPELDAMVRAADPMLDPRVLTETGLDSESALRRLALELDRPLGPRQDPSRHRPALRIAVLAVTVAAVVFAAANVASTGNDSAVPPAQAKALLRHVRAALRFPPHAIYEEEAVSTVTARDGASISSAYHEWMSTSWPYNSRLVEIANGKVEWEQALVNGSLDLYDPTTNTVYLAPPAARDPPCSTTRPSANPCQVLDAPQWNSALSEVQDLLRQPNVTVTPNVKLHGVPAIELTFDNGRFSYWISASNYQPLQIEDRQDALPDGQSGVGITRYPIARVLTGPAASPNLRSLQAQHPGATIDHSSNDYKAALSQLGIARPAFDSKAASSG